MAPPCGGGTSDELRKSGTSLCPGDQERQGDVGPSGRTASPPGIHKARATDENGLHPLDAGDPDRAVKLPSGDPAVVSQEKLVGYLLSPFHPMGRHKARFFRQLGYTAANWQAFRERAGHPPFEGPEILRARRLSPA